MSKAEERSRRSDAEDSPDKKKMKRDPKQKVSPVDLGSNGNALVSRLDDEHFSPALSAMSQSTASSTASEGGTKSKSSTSGDLAAMSRAPSTPEVKRTGLFHTLSDRPRMVLLSLPLIFSGG